MPAIIALAGDAWLHEPKLDGYRFQIVKDRRQVKLYSRKGHEWTKRLASLAEALQAIPRQSVVLDAELCFPGADGAPGLLPGTDRYARGSIRPSVGKRLVHPRKQTLVL